MTREATHRSSTAERAVVRHHVRRGWDRGVVGLGRREASETPLRRHARGVVHREPACDCGICLCGCDPCRIAGADAAKQPGAGRGLPFVLGLARRRAVPAPGDRGAGSGSDLGRCGPAAERDGHQRPLKCAVRISQCGRGRNGDRGRGLARLGFDVVGGRRRGHRTAANRVQEFPRLAAGAAETRNCEFRERRCRRRAPPAELRAALAPPRRRHPRRPRRRRRRVATRIERVAQTPGRSPA